MSKVYTPVIIAQDDDKNSIEIRKCGNALEILVTGRDLIVPHVRFYIKPEDAISLPTKIWKMLTESTNHPQHLSKPSKKKVTK